MTAGPGAFAASYVEARARFIAAAAAAGVPSEARRHPLRGREGEELALDVARDGHPNASKLLIISSGCHGVEGFCGSGVQVALLADAEFRARAQAAGEAVLYLHALNPYGFSHLRRTTHENIDLNRNFVDFDAPLPVNVAYREVHPLLVPKQWPPEPENTAAVQQYLAQHGAKVMQAVTSGGQHEFPDGLFFGGTAPSWSQKVLREALRSHGHRAGRIAWIDVHSGLGPIGVGERILGGRPHPTCVARARAWWDGGGRTPVTSVQEGTSSSAQVTGTMQHAAYDECPQAEFTGLVLEFGTAPLMETLQALRAEQWLNAHPEAPPALEAAIRRQILQAFYVDSDEWRGKVLAQAKEAVLQAVEGLAA